MAADITIDPEFQTMIPPLDGKTLAQLEENLVEAGGARDPLVVWKVDGKKILLDGHNRFAICNQKGLFFNVEELQLPDRESAKDWIDRHQIGRRNMTPEQLALLLGRRYNRTKKEKGAPIGNANRSIQMVQNAPFERSSVALAKEHGVHEQTIRRAGLFAEAVEKLGIEKEVVSNGIEQPKAVIIEAAKLVQKNPTREDVKQAINLVKEEKERAKKEKKAKEPAQVEEPEVKEDEEEPEEPWVPERTTLTKKQIAALPPCEGVKQAKRAISMLEQIDDNDRELGICFQMVGDYINERKAKA